MKRHVSMVLLLASWVAARAQSPEGISVVGHGEARGHTSAAEITAEVSGRGELAGDAIVKYGDAKRRALEALQGLGIENLTLQEGGISFGYSGTQDPRMQRMMGQGVDMPKEEIEVSEKLTLLLEGIEALDEEKRVDLLGQILDAANDAGLSLGEGAATTMFRIQMGQQTPQALVRFVMPNADDLMNQASREAVADAHARAERLAEMAGVKLGAIVSLNEGFDLGESFGPTAWPWSYYLGQQQAGERGKNRVLSSVYQSVPLRATVQVTFAIQK